MAVPGRKRAEMNEMPMRVELSRLAASAILLLANAILSLFSTSPLFRRNLITPNN
jgi:hypothetical protein